jgi:hypothetical protein
MTSTFTPNINLEEPARGDDVGTWDTPVNANMTLIDLVAGGIASIALTNANVTLSAAQFQSNRLTLSGALSGSVTLTFPTSFIKPYIIQNACTNSSAFTVTCATTAAGANVICLQPGELSQIYNSGANIRHVGLNPPIGGYWDYAGSSVPNWVSGCTQPPFLNCDGTSFSSATYPTLTQILGTTTLPDRRGTYGLSLNQGTARVTTAGAGVDGNTRFTVGGDQLLQTHTHTASVGTESANHTHAMAGAAFVVGQGSASFAGGGSNNTPTTGTVIGPATGAESAAHNHVVTNANAGSGGNQNIPPTTVTGIVMIRAI